MTDDTTTAESRTDIPGAPLVTDARGRTYYHYAVTGALTMVDAEGAVLDRDELAPEHRDAFVANVREAVGIQEDHRDDRPTSAWLADTILRLEVA